MDEQFELNKMLALATLKGLEENLQNCIKKIEEENEKFKKELDPALLSKVTDSKIQTGLAFNNFEGALTICVIADFYDSNDAMTKLREYKDAILIANRGF